MPANSLSCLFGEGDKAETYKFKVSDLIDHAQQKNKKGEDIYPVRHLDPKSMADNIEARKGSEKGSKKGSKKSNFQSL